MSFRVSCVCLILSASITIVGCSGKPGRLDPPSIPDDAGQRAVTAYDANGNGTVEGDELAKVPALKTALKRVDANNDGQVSAEEINERINAWRKSRVAITRGDATVTLDGRPVSGAVVKLIPEPFLGPALKAAQGTTGPDGSCFLEIARNPDESGVQLGYYRIEITQPDADGKERIPARYNVQTELGAEITNGEPASLKLNLTGK